MLYQNISNGINLKNGNFFDTDWRRFHREHAKRDESSIKKYYFFMKSYQPLFLQENVSDLHESATIKSSWQALSSRIGD